MSKEEKEKLCSKCSKPITGKNFRAVDGELTHKICPRTVEEKSKKVKKAPKVGISTARQENAHKLIEFLTSLEIDDTEKRKVMSRAYGIISKTL